MEQATTYKRSLSGSIGAGMKSIMGGGGRRYFVLEHKISSQFHKAGESQKIIVDQIELGRDASCAVRFDESFKTVSRHHAAIVRSGDNWKLVQLSHTNSTYLNGRKVEKEWYLQSGDEIQLSTNGPRLGFIVPAGDKSLVKSIGMTARLNLFRQQALRPYKNAIAALAALLIVLGCLGGYYVWKTGGELDNYKTQFANIEEAKARQDALLAEQAAQLEAQKEEIKKAQKEAAKAKTTATINASALDAAKKNVYFIVTDRYEITFNGETRTLQCGQKGVPAHSATGFLLSDGRFVTARHVVEPWAFWYQGGELDEDMYTLNAISNNGGSVRLYLTAYSSNGSQISLCSNNMTVNRSNDQHGTDDDGTRLSLAAAGTNDYAYFRTSRSGGLAYDPSLSRNLKSATELNILGFPLGLGGDSPSSINTVLTRATVAMDGVYHEQIVTTLTSFEHGNSGGPVFSNNDKGELVVVGIVSAGAGRSTGLVVPISAIN